MSLMPTPATDDRGVVSRARGSGRRNGKEEQDMKLSNRERFLAATMIVAALCATGCRRGRSDDDSASNQPQPAGTDNSGAQAPVPAQTAPGAEQAPAPPAPQQEASGPAPSTDHFWVNGHWKWVGRRYEWIPGHWAVSVAPSAPPAIRYENPGYAPSTRHVWMRGYWKWSGTEWTWVGGHWDYYRPGHTWVDGHWDARGGRWHWVAGQWR
jgi:hypothetical protein